MTETSQKCRGPLPDHYATKICSELRNNAATPDLLLSGKGFQCKLLFPIHADPYAQGFRGLETRRPPAKSGAT